METILTILCLILDGLVERGEQGTHLLENSSTIGGGLRRVTSSHVESRRVRKGFTLYVTDHRIALRLRKGVKSLRKGVKVLRRASVKVLRKGVKAGAQGPARSAVGPPRAPGRVT
jgi:hypothetical protein